MVTRGINKPSKIKVRSYCFLKILYMQVEWIKVFDEVPEHGIEVLGYNKKLDR